MKFLVIFAMTVFAFRAHSQGAGRNYIDGLGVVQSRVAETIVVRNSAASALTIGMGVCLDLTDKDGINVDFCAVAGNKPLCVITDTSCAVGARCKCLTKGYFASGALKVAGNISATAGQPIYASVDGTLYAIAPASPVSNPIVVQKFPIGVTLDSSAVDATIKIFVDP